MKTKTYIVALLTFIFVGKFIAIDANGVNALFGGDDNSIVNFTCKKIQSFQQSSKTADITQATDTLSNTVSSTGFCTAQFHFDIIAWETGESNPIVVFNNRFSSNLSSRYLESISPPPRLV